MKPTLSSLFVTSLLCASLTTSSLAAPGAAPAQNKGVYGDDNRQDLYQVTDPRYREWARSTVALMSEESLKPALHLFGPAKQKVRTSSYALENDLCREERFYEQRTAAFCSGSLVGPDLVLTAGHCVRNFWSCSTMRLVFDWGISKAGSETPGKVLEKNIYRCATVIDRTEEANGPDYALIRLDRPVVGRKPLPINRSGQIAQGTPLVVIGHPMGLPTKVTDGAKVWDPTPAGYFTSDADTYGGNSGSPVINTQTGLIEGVLVRGGKDLEMDWSRGCARSYVCNSQSATPTCRGEDITKISAVAGRIPQ